MFFYCHAFSLGSLPILSLILGPIPSICPTLSLSQGLRLPYLDETEVSFFPLRPFGFSKGIKPPESKKGKRLRTKRQRTT